MQRRKRNRIVWPLSTKRPKSVHAKRRRIGWPQKLPPQKRHVWRKKSANGSMAAAELDAEYREFVAAGDIAFSVEDFDKAILKYNAALGCETQ